MATTIDNKIWFHNQALDLFVLFVLSPMIAIFLFLLIYLEVPDFIGAIVVGAIIDIPHQAQTHILLLANQQEFSKIKVPYIISATVIGLFCTFFAYTGYIIIPVTVWAYWLIFHIILQHFGIAALYAKRAGYSGSTSNIKHLILAGTTAPILYRMAKTGITFTTPINSLEIVTPTIPHWIYIGMYVIFCFLLLEFILKEIKLKKNSNNYHVIVYVIISYIVLLYNGFFLFEKNLLIFLLISTVLHAVQYHLVAGNRTITILSYQNVYDSKIDTPIQCIIRKIVNNKLLWLLVVILIGGLIFLSNQFSYGVIPLTWSMQHFYLDGFIWRRPKEKTVVE